MPSESSNQFETLIGSVDQLVAIHAKLQQGPGRRYEQDAIHRAGVVLSVAAWQAYVEKVLVEGLSKIELQIRAPIAGAPPPQWALSSFLVRQAAIKKTTSDFNTPNTQNVQRLFKDALDFDPWPSWTWHARRRQWDSTMFRARTDGWLRIRHTIVHGSPLPTNLDWLQGANRQPRLTLNLLKECRKHFHFLVQKTDEAFSAHLRDQHDLALPW